MLLEKIPPLVSLGRDDRSIGNTIQPHGLYSLRCLAMDHRRYIAWFRSSTRVVFGTWRAADCRPYGHVGERYRSTPQVIFGTWRAANMSPLHTQPLCACCSYNAERRTAPHPPPTAVPLPRRGRFCVVPFNRTSSMRNAPGTAHRPFPTVSLVGVFFNQRISKAGTSVPC